MSYRWETTFKTRPKAQIVGGKLMDNDIKMNAFKELISRRFKNQQEKES